MVASNHVASNHLTAIMALTTKIDTGWFWSGNFVENSSSISHTNIKFPRLGYHKVCARQWQEYCPWVIRTILQVWYLETSSNGSLFVIIWCILSFSSIVGILSVIFHSPSFFWNSLTLPSLNFMKFSLTTSCNSPQIASGQPERSSLTNCTTSPTFWPVQRI